MSSQSYKLQGKITDTLNQPLQNANILAIPELEGLKVEFSITDEKGRYSMSLNANENYNIEISFLGYRKITYPITLSAEQTKDFSLEESNEILDEVVIAYKLPVVVKKDTIIYRTDVFKTGEERKLRELLNKLPGVEVDRLGNVTVNGKAIDQLLVDGKPFFTGDEKLGVNNIPADVVDEVVVLDNYTEIAFLKGLSDSNKMALNIKLKEGKNKFMFGDIKAGGGAEDRYLVNPTLFYYSPKTSVNTIIDVNNTGQKSFTFQDYIDFEGGFTRLMDNPQGMNDIFDSDFLQALQQQDLVFNAHRFGAFSLDHKFNPKLTLRAYSINSLDDSESLTTQNNLYFADEVLIDDENRSTDAQNKTFSTLNKLMFQYNPSLTDDLRYEVIVKAIGFDANEKISTNSLTQNNFINTLKDGNSFEIAQTLEYNKQFSYKHTSTLNAGITFNQSNADTRWNFSKEVLNTAIPFAGEAPYNVVQNIDREDVKANLDLKHYWILNDKNHIYPVAGFQFSKQSYSTLDVQELENETNNFQEAGFNNDNSFSLADAYIGFQYKAKAGKFTFKPGIIYHHYAWQVNQFEEQQLATTKPQILPELMINWDLKLRSKVKLQYNLQSRFQDIASFSDRFRLQNFNAIFQGNNALENDLNHRLSLRYSNYSFLKGIFFNAGINYNRKFQSTQNTTITQGINQINTPIFTDIPEETLSLNSSFSKKLRKLRFALSVKADFSNYTRLINGDFIDYQSENYTYNASFKTRFKKNPNVEVGFGQTFNSFSSNEFINNFTQTNPFLILSYDFLNGFIFNADYRYTLFVNEDRNEENIFEIGGASLFYNKENSPWGFEIEVINLFDASAKNSNNFSEFIISDNTIFIQPRTVLFKLSYKL